MPRTSNPPLRSHDTQFQRSTIVGTFRGHSVNLTIIPNQEDLAILNTVDFTLDLVHVLDVRQGRDVLEFVILGHFEGIGGEGCT